MSWCLACLGELAAGCALLGRVIEDDVPAAPMSGSGVIALAHSTLALNAMLAGPKEEALAEAEAGVERARRSGHSLSLAYAAAVDQSLGEVEPVRRPSDEVLPVALNRGIASWVALARILGGWVGATDGEAEDGVERIRAGIALYTSTRGSVLLPSTQGLLAYARAASARTTPPHASNGCMPAPPETTQGSARCSASVNARALARVRRPWLRASGRAARTRCSRSAAPGP